jgi:hypothetical protein
MAANTTELTPNRSNEKPALRDFRQEVTDNIVRMLERGVAPWQKPWEPGGESVGIPRKVAMSISGHRRESVYLRYDIVSQRDLAIARESWKHFTSSRRKLVQVSTIGQNRQPLTD